MTYWAIVRIQWDKASMTEPSTHLNNNLSIIQSKMMIFLKGKWFFLEDICPIVYSRRSKHAVWVEMKSQFPRRSRCVIIESCVWLLTSIVMVRIWSQSNWEILKDFGIWKDILGIVQRPKPKVRLDRDLGGVGRFSGQHWAIKAVEGTSERNGIHVYGCLLSFRYQAHETSKE